MAKVHVTAQKDFLESLTNARPFAALAELIWNGFDAQSDHVQVNLDLNTLGGIEAIRVRDHGAGIFHPHVDNLFGKLGDSWKKAKGRDNGRSLHGKNGKGRFKAFSLGQSVTWNTTYRDNGKAYSFQITGNAISLDDFDSSEPVEANGAGTGTEVTISNIRYEFGSLLADSAPLEIAKIFAAYLAQYPYLVLDYNGHIVDPAAAQRDRSNYHLGDVALANGTKVPVAVTIVEWAIPTDRAIHLCDADGISLHEIVAGPQIKAPGFEFTAYVKADHFRELDKQGSLVLADLHPDVETLVKAARNKIKEHFRRRLAEDQSHIVERWKKEEIYPYEDKSTLDPVELAERQVFDIVAVNVQSYLPWFEDADLKSRKFTFRLLAQALRENPDSVQKIIGDVLGLKKEAQDDLAALLEQTPLSSVISFAKTVANRLDFLDALDGLLFNKETKKRLLERDQLHRILENEAWIFDEGFHLAGSEQRLEEVLKKHLSTLGKREDDPDPVTLSDGSRGRIDLMLQRVGQPRAGEHDYLVVELKRPLKKIDADVLRQVEEYAIAVASDERFKGVPARWTFVAISNDMDASAQRKSEQLGRPKGMVYADATGTITVWAKTWSEVINNARARLHFVANQLSYQANDDTARAYLAKAHAKFIPPPDSAKSAPDTDSAAPAS